MIGLIPASISNNPNGRSGGSFSCGSSANIDRVDGSTYWYRIASLGPRMPWTENRREDVKESNDD